jgi:SAM-dependent methyltransferase
MNDLKIASSVLEEHWEFLCCPVTRKPLSREGDALLTDCGRRYPIVAGVPVLLDPAAEATHGVFRDSLENAELVARNWIAQGWFNIDRHEIHPFVQAVVAATSGYLYVGVIGKLTRYPIPHLRLPPGGGRTLVDIGCNWGRWSIAAAENGYSVIGVDPSIEGVFAAREVARQRGIPASFVVGDARCLPIRDGSMDIAFSYSVLQHLSKDDVRKTLETVKRLLTSGGKALIQMPNVFGIRCLWHQFRRRFREPRGFEVRYWTPSELKQVFTDKIGPSQLTVDGFFGLGIQPTDKDLFSPFGKFVVLSSEILRSLSLCLPCLWRSADSLYVESTSASSS